MSFNLKEYLKPGKDIVVEINEVEYLLNDNAVQALERGDKDIPLIQLYDRKTYSFDVEKIKESLTTQGVIDYLDT